MEESIDLRIRKSTSWVCSTNTCGFQIFLGEKKTASVQTNTAQWARVVHGAHWMSRGGPTNLFFLKIFLFFSSSFFVLFSLIFIIAKNSKKNKKSTNGLTLNLFIRKILLITSFQFICLNFIPSIIIIIM